MSPLLGCEGGWGQVQSGSPWSPCSGLTRHMFLFSVIKLMIIKVWRLKNKKNKKKPVIPPLRGSRVSIYTFFPFRHFVEFL